MYSAIGPVCDKHWQIKGHPEGHLAAAFGWQEVKAVDRAGQQIRGSNFIEEVVQKEHIRPEKQREASERQQIANCATGSSSGPRIELCEESPELEELQQSGRKFKENNIIETKSCSRRHRQKQRREHHEPNRRRPPAR